LIVVGNIGKGLLKEKESLKEKEGEFDPATFGKALYPFTPGRRGTTHQIEKIFGYEKKKEGQSSIYNVGGGRKGKTTRHEGKRKKYSRGTKEKKREHSRPILSKKKKKDSDSFAHKRKKGKDRKSKGKKGES